MRFKALTAALLLSASVGAAQAGEAVQRSGVYVGVHGGYSFADLKIEANGSPFAIDGLSAEGFRGGAQLGFDYQFPGSPFVLGAFGEYSFGETQFEIAPNILTATIENSWAVGAKAGLMVGNALPYVVAGYTQADGKATLLGASASETLEGYFAGGGIAIQINQNIDLGAEYRFTQFDSVDLGGGVDLDPTMHSVMARLNWRVGDLFR